MNQDDYAHDLGVSVSALNMYERSERDLPKDRSTLHWAIGKCLDKNAENLELRNNALRIDHSENIQALYKMQKQISFDLMLAKIRHDKLQSAYNDSMKAIGQVSKIPDETITVANSRGLRILKGHYNNLLLKIDRCNLVMRTKSAMRLAAAEAELKVVSEAIAESEKILGKS